ncbi:AAA family ATPase [Treponema primitia]|uniref:AAA family ATPase n=1 Tax=Treponema primitia TaxID=88058 RepID=UPI0002555374|nr:ATP-binding protein [Treponema primitia]
MLYLFSIKNYRGFKDTITLDLSASNYEFNPECIHDGCAYKALIYGYNGVGKSNLGLAIMDIVIQLTDKEKSLLLNKNYLNAETDSDIVEFIYKFKFNESIVEYKYGKTTPETIVYEYLSIDNKSIVSYNRSTDDKLKINLPGTEMLNKDINKIPISIIKYIKSNAVLKESSETSVFLNFLDFVDRMLFFRNLDDRAYIGYSVGSGKLFDDIIEKKHFDDFRNFFKKAELPSNFEYQKIGDQYKVFFNYKTNSAETNFIDFFQNCSTGMKSLCVFYYWLQYVKFSKTPPSFIFIDEFDAFYHQVLSEFVINEIKNINNCQFILTTHDTSVMSNDFMRPDCLFLMYKNKIKSLSSLTEKEIRFAHNVEKMYRAGAFDE